MRAVCYIPGIDCLVYHRTQHWISRFEHRAEKTPTDVVLPAFASAGASYRSTYATPVERLGDQNTLPHWMEQTRDLLAGAKVWASITVTLPSLSNEMNALRDQWEQPMSDACIVNPHVQEILSSIFHELSEIGVGAVALDMTDAFPNSTSARFPKREDGSRPLQNSCFCTYCLDTLRRATTWEDGAKPFQSWDRSLSRFVLKSATAPSDGASWNEVNDLWLANLDGGALAAFADATGFTNDEVDGGRKDAVTLLRYLSARAKITALTAKRLHESAAKEGLETAIVLGSSSYDMSQNVNLRTLVEHSAADEYWAPSFSPSQQEEGGPVLLRFLATRGSYYLNALFENLDLVTQSRTPEQSDPHYQQLLKNAMALSNRDEFQKGQCAQVELYRGLSGFVGIPFGENDFIDLIDAKAEDGSLAGPVRSDLVSRLRRGVTDAGSATDITQDEHSTWR